jgi:hypothetical protein
VYKWIVLSLSISSDFWLRWLMHEAWHGIRAQGLEFESWFLQFIVKIVVAPLCAHVLTFPVTVATSSPRSLFRRFPSWPQLLFSLDSSHVSGGVDVYKWIA